MEHHQDGEDTEEACETQKETVKAIKCEGELKVEYIESNSNCEDTTCVPASFDEQETSRYAALFNQEHDEGENYTNCNATVYVKCEIKDESSGDNVSMEVDEVESIDYSEDNNSLHYDNDVTLECFRNDKHQEDASVGGHNNNMINVEESLNLDEATGWFEGKTKDVSHKESDQTSTTGPSESTASTSRKLGSIKRQYLCEKCPHLSPGPSALKRHMAKHSKEKPYRCELCPFGTGWASVLRRHVAITHGKDKSHACPACSYSTGWASALKQHMKTHEESKPFQCDSCSYRCVAVSDLRKHAVTHTKDKPFSCSLCDYSTGWATSLKRHVASVHAEGKTHACEACGFATRWAESLRGHMKTHSDSKPHRCASCPYSTRHAGDLKKHAVTHTREKPFKCALCPFASGWANSLSSHVLTKHAKDVNRTTQC